MRYGLIEITDWIFLFFGRNEKKIRVQKNGRKTAIKFSESARFFASWSAEIKQTSFYFGLL